MLRGVESNHCPKVMSLVRYLFSTPLYKKALKEHIDIVLKNTKIAMVSFKTCYIVVYFICFIAVVAQLVERFHGKEEVRGSIPRNGSM